MKKEENKKPEAQQEDKTLHKNMSFAAAEAYKLLRTNLMFTLPEQKDCRVIGITSSLRDEGKSTTAINLSYTLAQTGKRVLLIDADMRLPSIAKKMKLTTKQGLSNILISDEKSPTLRVTKSNVLDNWHIMCAGDIPPNPSELLGSERMKALLTVLESHYEFVVFDLPPMNVVTDALVISPLLDGLLVVIREDHTDRRSLRDCVRQIKLSDAKLLGFVMNRSKEGEGSYRKYKYRKNYRYYKKYYKSSSAYYQAEPNNNKQS